MEFEEGCLHGEFFACSKCRKYYVLPTCCDHYIEDQQDKIDHLTKQLKEKDERIAELDKAIMEFIEHNNLSDLHDEWLQKKGKRHED